MKRDMEVLDARSVEREVLSAKEFVNLTPEQKSRISDTRVVAPKLGDSGFGGVEVKYKTPLYKVL
jgi:hypothetical protein